MALVHFFFVYWHKDLTKHMCGKTENYGFESNMQCHFIQFGRSIVNV